MYCQNWRRAGCRDVEGRPRASSARQRGRCKPGPGRNGKHHRVSHGPATAKKERRPHVTMASPPEEDAIRAVYRPATERCQQVNPRRCDRTQVRQCQAISNAFGCLFGPSQASCDDTVDEVIAEIKARFTSSSHAAPAKPTRQNRQTKPGRPKTKNVRARH